MMLVVLIAGIGLLLAGLVTVALGIQLDLSFGNTLILTGAIVACTGAMLLGLWVLVRELKNLARQFGPGMSLEPRAGNLLSSAATNVAPGLQADGGLLFSGDQPAPDHTAHAASPPPWQTEVASRDRVRADIPPEPEPAEAEPAVKPRRNLLFSSSSRKERERAQARTPDPSVDDLPPAAPAAPPPPESSEPPPVTFDDAWPKSERSRTLDTPLPRRSGRTPSTFTEASAGIAAPDRHPPTPRNEEPPPVTVLKSGVVDGMAYSLYSDGSIEAQMPEGMMRFASIDELRSHLDQRP